MTKFFGFLFLCFLIISCREKVQNFSDIEEMFQLKNYEKKEKRIINDSITHYIAEREDFILKGNFNTKLNVKTGIWSLRNVKDFQEVQIDYFAFGKNDVFKNQIIFRAPNQRIDTLKSKFFIVKFKSLQNLKLKFFSPESKNEISKQAKIRYLVYRNKIMIKEDSIVYKNSKNGKYFADIKYNFKKGDYVTGYFSEYVQISNKTNKDSVFMGNDTIYFFEDFD